MWRHPVVVLAGLCIAFALGLLVGRGWSPRTPPDDRIPVDHRIAIVDPANAASSRRDPAARSRNTASGDDAVVGARKRNTDADWAALADFKQRKLADSRLSFLAPGRKIHPDFAQVFDLSPREREALQSSVDRDSEKLAGLERANATIARDEKGIVTIEVKPFVADGAATYDQLMREIAATLGESRYRSFNELGAGSLEYNLRYFGAEERSLRFSYDPSRVPNPYIVRDDYKRGARERGGDTKAYQSHAEMVDRIGTITRLLPPGMGEP